MILEHILCSQAEALRSLIQAGRQVHFLLEQPAQSWAFKLPTMLELRELGGWFLGFGRTTTIYYTTMTSMDCQRLRISKDVKLIQSHPSRFRTEMNRV